MRIVRFRYSKDGGNNWSDFRDASLGEVGEFVRDIEWNRLGRGRQWVFDISNTSPVRADLLAASVKLEGTA